MTWWARSILIPIFDQATGSGSHGQYRVYGYAAFKFTGYYFSGTYKGTEYAAAVNGASRATSLDMSTSTRFWTSAPGPQLGASIVTLTD